MSLVVFGGGKGLLTRALPYMWSAGQYMIEWLAKTITQVRATQAMKALGPVVTSEVTKTGEFLITTVGDEARNLISVRTTDQLTLRKQTADRKNARNTTVVVDRVSVQVMEAASEYRKRLTKYRDDLKANRELEAEIVELLS